MTKSISRTFLKKLGYKSIAQASRKTKVPYSTLRNWLMGARARDPKRVERVRKRAIKRSPKAKELRHPLRFRTKNYDRNELDRLTVFATTIGMDDLTSRKLSESKFDQIANAVFSDKSIRLARAERFDETRRRFLSIVEQNFEDNEAQQMAGQAIFNRYEKIGKGMKRYSQAFVSELQNAIEFLFSAIRVYPLGIEPNSNEIKSTRGNALFYTTNPQHFLQTLNYLSDLGVAQKYFGVYFYHVESGEIAIQVFERTWK